PVKNLYKSALPGEIFSIIVSDVTIPIHQQTNRYRYHHSLEGQFNASSFRPNILACLLWKEITHRLIYHPYPVTLRPVWYRPDSRRTDKAGHRPVYSNDRSA